MSYGKEELRSILRRLDEEAFLTLGAISPRPRIVIVGGGALLLSDLTARNMTHDIDVLHADARLREIINNYHALNGAVSAYVDSIPYNFESRLVQLDFDTALIEFFPPVLRTWR